MSEKRHNKIVKINPKTFSTKMMYDIFLDFVQEGEDGWEVVRNKPWPYGAVLKVPNWKDGEYGYAGIMYGQIKGKGKKHSYTVNKKTSYGQWITESKNLQKLAYSTIFPSYEKGYEKEDWRFFNGKIQEWETREQSSSQKRYNFSYGDGVLENEVSAGDTSVTVIMNTLTLTGTIKKGTYITIGNKEVVVTNDTSSYTKTYTKPKTDAEGNIVTDNNGNPILVPVTKNCIDIEFSPALNADCPKDTTVNLPSKDKQYITVLTEGHIATNGYYQIREAEHFYTDADVIWFSMFKQYEPSFDWNELMENTRKNPCAKRLGYSWYSWSYPAWETEAPIYPGEGCPALSFSATESKTSSSGSSQEYSLKASSIPRYSDLPVGVMYGYYSLVFGDGQDYSMSNLYMTTQDYPRPREITFAEALANNYVKKVTVVEWEDVFNNLSKFNDESHTTIIERNGILYNAHFFYYSGIDKYMTDVNEGFFSYIAACSEICTLKHGERDLVCGAHLWTGFFCKGGIYYEQLGSTYVYYYATTAWSYADDRESKTIDEAVDNAYAIRLELKNAKDVNALSLKNSAIIPKGLYYSKKRDKYYYFHVDNTLVLGTPINQDIETALDCSIMYLSIDSKGTVFRAVESSGIDSEPNPEPNPNPEPSTKPDPAPSGNSILPEYVYLYMSKTKHNANIAVNYREWWDMAQIGFFEPFASDYEYQFPALAMSSNIGVRPCNHLVSYSGTPYPYDNMLFDYTQGNRSWGHSMIGYSATWWDGTQEFLDKHACSQTQAMLPSGKWESFFNYAIKSDCYYNYVYGKYAHGFKEPKRVQSKYFITNTMTPNVEENFNVIPYGIETNGYPFDMTSLELEIARQNKQSYSLLPFYLGTNIEDNNEQNMICAVPAMYAVSRPVTRYGLYRNPTDKDDLFLIMPNCWEGRPWHYQQDAVYLYTNKNKTEDEQQEEYDKYRDWGKNMNVAMHIGTNTSFEQIEDYVAKTKEFD